VGGAGGPVEWFCSIENYPDPVAFNWLAFVIGGPCDGQSGTIECFRVTGAQPCPLISTRVLYASAPTALLGLNVRVLVEDTGLVWITGPDFTCSLPWGGPNTSVFENPCGQLGIAAPIGGPCSGQTFVWHLNPGS
jgi:hypothetical protein